MENEYVHTKPSQQRLDENNSRLATGGIHERAALALAEDAITPKEFDALLELEKTAKEARNIGAVEISQIERHRGYTAEHKQRLIAEWEGRQQKTFYEARADTQTTVDKIVARESVLNVPKPIKEQASLEAALTNARRDAILELSAEDDAAGIYGALEDMATRDDDPELRYLILETRFVESYLRGTKKKPLLEGWRNKKTNLKLKALGRKSSRLEAVMKLKHLPNLIDMHFRKNDGNG